MKICWNNLDGVRLTRNGTFRKGEVTYTYKEACTVCGEPYLVEKRRQNGVCGHSCAFSGKNHPLYGKHHTVEAKTKMSESSSGKFGVLNSNYKGDKAGFAIYNTYRGRLDLYEDIRKQQATKMLEAKCVYCGKWHVPTRMAVDSRIAAISNLNKGEQRLYCSDNCKQACPTYCQKTYPKGFKHATSREVSTYLRQMVMERDNWVCQKCGNTIENAQLHCHHMDPVAQNPMFQNDMDSCITLCKSCHKEVHMQYGCRYVDLQCKKRK